MQHTTLQALYPLSWQEDGIAESTSAWQPAIPEKLLHCLWFDPHWRPPVLRTVAGQAFTVQTPGQWNRLPGPDFRQAVLVFADGTRYRGDVEIHRNASGWRAHHHHHDTRYNQVILHVFLWNDRPSDVYRADGQAIFQVDLGSVLPRPIEAYHAEIVLDDYPHKHTPTPGRCYEALQRLSPEEILAFLNRAGDARVYQRSQRWGQRAFEAGFPQVMYEAIMRSLGSTGHRQQFQELAHLLPWHEAADVLQTIPALMRPLAAEALLFGMAGLLPAAIAADTDTEAHLYAMRLRHFWESFPAVLRNRAWHEESHFWRQPNVRPANTPERRLAGMAQILALHAETTLFDGILQRCRTPHSTGRSLCRALQLLLTPSLPSYWARRAHYHSLPQREQRLIGPQRALTIVVDAIVPVVLLWAQHQKDDALRSHVMQCFYTAPRLPENHLLRYITCRLLGNDPTFCPLITGARQQQGLLQILADFCSHDEGDCQGCDFPLLSATSP